MRWLSEHDAPSEYPSLFSQRRTAVVERREEASRALEWRDKACWCLYRCGAVRYAACVRVLVCVCSPIHRHPGDVIRSSRGSAVSHCSSLWARWPAPPDSRSSPAAPPCGRSLAAKRSARREKPGRCAGGRTDGRAAATISGRLHRQSGPRPSSLRKLASRHLFPALGPLSGEECLEKRFKRLMTRLSSLEKVDE